MQRSKHWVFGIGALAMAHLAHAQDASGAPSRAYSWTPHLSVNMSATDNLKLRDSEKDGALITTIAPGISAQARGPRLKGSLDYSINALQYAKTDRSGQIQHQLASRLNAELVDNAVFMDAAASISQQTVSAQGQQAIGNLNPISNRTEVGTLQLSPSARARLGDMAVVDLRLTRSETRAKNTQLGDNSLESGSLSVSGSGQRKLNWSLNLASTKTAPKVGREAVNDRLFAALLYKPDVDLDLSARAGRERSNYTSTDASTAATYGADMQWTPTPRSKFSLSLDHHSYGNSHAVSLEHRMARSVWRYADSRSVDNGGGQGSVGGRSNYDMIYSMLASTEPDPVARQKLTNQLLQQFGLSADAISTPGFLTAALTIARRQELSFALEGIRSTLTLQASRTSNTRLGALSLIDDGLGGATVVRQRGLSASFAYKLTPESATSLVYQIQHSDTDLLNQASTLRALSASWNWRLGRRTTVALGARRATFESLIAPYTERSVYGTLQQQF